MIDLFLIKLNGEYDDIGATPNIQNGLFLCDTTGETYTRGYSYQITDGNAARIDSVKDYKIKQSIYPTIQSVCEWLNNWFFTKKDCKFGCVYHNVFTTGDLVKIIDSNPQFVSYVTVTENSVIVDNELFDAGIHFKMVKMAVPQDFEAAISKMIYYDVYTRGTVDDLKSENIGSYSYTKNETTIGSLAYPAELVSGLEANYKKIRFVQ